MNNSYTVLFDYDSMIYKAVYRIASISDIKCWFKEKRSRQWMEEEIINLTLNRLANMGDSIFLEIEDTGINITDVEYFLTVCKNSKRKEATPTYKVTRKGNKWVNVVRKRLLSMDSFSIHDEWEADDLIKDRAVEIGEEDCVILSIDKDLKQIPGIHFDYYRPILKNSDGSRQLDENGFRKVAPCRGLDIVTKDQAELFFWTQMLMGDTGDDIKGVPGIGKVKAGKILKSEPDLESKVIDTYVNYFGVKEGKDQYDKHYLLLKLGVNYR